ncbi:helix-turn-helix transcriptional regulator [Solibacillus sp. FSL R7-0682]|uniref:helix-turn-helix domain-containing protein n=1 Tax=Solibacillus sp. FSL R7-0682 TaxID=2921690 RepID=UPI0030F726C9
MLKERDLSQRELARMTGLRPNTISHLCSDNVDRVYLTTIETVCKVLEINIQELIEVE